MTAALTAERYAAGDWRPLGFADYRFGLLLPMAIGYRVGLTGLTAVTAWPFVSGLVTLAAVYAIVARRCSPIGGAVAVALLAVLPFQITLSTRAYPDGPQAGFTTLALALLLTRRAPFRRVACFGAGFLIGLAWLTKVTAVVPLAVGLLWLLVVRREWRSAGYFIFGFGVVFASEHTAYALLEGDLFAREDAILSSMRASGPKAGYSFVDPLRLPTEFFVLPNEFGLFCFLGLWSLVQALRRPAFPEHRLIALWALAPILAVWGSSLTPIGLSQFTRYVSPAIPAVAALIAIACANEFGRHGWFRWVAASAVPAQIIAGLLLSVLGTVHGEDTRGLVAVGAWLRTHARSAPVYVNARSDKVLSYLFPELRHQIVRYGGRPGAASARRDPFSQSEGYVVVARNTLLAAKERWPDEVYPAHCFDDHALRQGLIVIDNPAPKVAYAMLDHLDRLASVLLPAPLAAKVSREVRRILRTPDVVLVVLPAQVGGRRKVATTARRDP